MSNSKKTIEIEIRPSEAIEILEKFKKACENFNSYEISHKIVDENDFPAVVRSFYEISPELNLILIWRPKYIDYKLINL